MIRIFLVTNQNNIISNEEKKIDQLKYDGNHGKSRSVWGSKPINPQITTNKENPYPPHIPYWNLKQDIGRTKLTKWKSQLGNQSESERTKIFWARKDSLSTKADFFKVESKQLDDEFNQDPSCSSSDNKESFIIHHYDNSNPVSFRARNRSQLSREWWGIPYIYLK